MFEQHIIEAINRTKVQQIRAGKTHRFVDISIVEANGRLFVRQYKFANNSWRQAFQHTPEGAIRCGGFQIEIQAKVPDDLSSVNALVNEAFRRKLPIIYTLMRWTFDVNKHEASTLELIPVIDSY